MSTIELDIQIESQVDCIPDKGKISQWVCAALSPKAAEITIRIVDEKESAYLNQTYRSKENATNVLSFPFSPLHDEATLHGDIVLCAPILNKEAAAQNKSSNAHWAHLIIHGLLHLQGFDHIKEDEAKIMEAQEIRLLTILGYPNPYE